MGTSHIPLSCNSSSVDYSLTENLQRGFLHCKKQISNTEEKTIGHIPNITLLTIYEIKCFLTIKMKSEWLPWILIWYIRRRWAGYLDILNRKYGIQNSSWGTKLEQHLFLFLDHLSFYFFQAQCNATLAGKCRDRGVGSSNLLIFKSKAMHPDLVQALYFSVASGFDEHTGLHVN